MAKCDFFIALREGKRCALQILETKDSGEVIFERIEGSPIFNEDGKAVLRMNAYGENTLTLSAGPVQLNLKNIYRERRILKEAPILEVTMSDIEKKFGRKVKIVEKKEG